MGLVLALQLVTVPGVHAQERLRALVPERPAGMVTDRADLLDATTRDRIEVRLRRLRDSTGGEVAVVTLPGLDGYAPVEVATEIGRQWGVGGAYEIGDPRRNAAAVLLLVPRTPEQRGEVFIGSGTGAEGFLTDARAGEIRDAMLPMLREADYATALDVGTTLLADLFARELGSTDSALVQPRRERGRAGWVMLPSLCIKSRMRIRRS